MTTIPAQRPKPECTPMIATARVHFNRIDAQAPRNKREAQRDDQRSRKPGQQTGRTGLHDLEEILMPRPTCIEEVEDYLTKPHEVFRINPEQLLRHPAVAAMLMAAVEVAVTDDRLNFDEITGGCTRQLSPSEESDVLRRAQRSWDSDHAFYEQWMAGEDIEPWKVGSARLHATKEGLPTPDQPMPFVPTEVSA